MPHVSARLVGHGLVVIPREGYRVERVAGAPETTLRITHGDVVETVDLLAASRDGCAVAEVLAGGARGPWRIQTSVFTCLWPEGFTLTEDPDGSSPFLLSRSGSALVWANGPLPRDAATPIEKLVGDDQEVRAVAMQGDNARLDVDYAFDDERWWQRRYALVWGKGQVLVLSAQALAEDEADACAAVDVIAQSVEPYRPD